MTGFVDGLEMGNNTKVQNLVLNIQKVDYMSSLSQTIFILIR